jgi:dTDP-4-dehydrorhamnose 3,5-epimerase
MIASTLHLPGLVLFEPKVFHDHRGYFFESFHQKRFEEAVGRPVQFVQDNQSRSHHGVMRGLHFQVPPHAQAKLIRVVQGQILDVVVDVRAGSPTFGQYAAVVLSEHNKKQLFVPAGFAHGFVVQSESAEICYRCDQYYAPAHEAGLHFADPALGIDWQAPLDRIVASEKDLMLPMLAQFSTPFQFEG